MKRYVALVPAAGGGSRFGGSLPKQYQLVCGQPMIYRTVARLIECASINAVFVILSRDDRWWNSEDAHGLGPKLQTLRCGGATRAESVLNALTCIATDFDASDWVLVHDAARPLIRPTAIDALIREVGDDPAGGLLAFPAADTMKRADDEQRVTATESRAMLWHAQTPQMFPLALLLGALQEAPPDITDDAQAIERLGLKPRLVLGHRDNVKITFPEDLEWAEAIIQAEKK